MGELDWNFLTDSLAASTVDRGVTAGVTPPSGGGSFIFGFNSLAVAEGGVALKATPAASPGFDPMVKGGSVRGVIKRGASGGNTGWSPFLFLLAQGNSVNDNAYLLGLEDNDPFRIVLRKAAIVSGIPVATSANAMRTSSESFLVADDAWIHLRLDAVVNLNGDVILKVFRNDLTAHPIPGPYTWLAIPGMADFVDDALAINTGTQPYTSGRAGFGVRVQDSTRRAYFDQLEVLRQL